MRVLVTRPAADAACTAQALAERGHEAIVAPVIEIRFCPGEIPVAPCQAVLATSANAVRALAAHPALGRLTETPVLAVGDRTAEAARLAGFRDVVSAGGAAEDLMGLVRNRLKPKAGPLLYPSGREVASQLDAELGSEGYEVARVVVYKAAAVEALPEPAQAALRQGRADAALVYSPRSARVLLELAGRAGLGAAIAALPLVCLSDAVADAARAAGARRLLAAERPDEEALLALLDALSR